MDRKGIRDKKRSDRLFIHLSISNAGAAKRAIAYLFTCQSIILSKESVLGVFKTYPRFGIGDVDQVF